MADYYTKVSFFLPSSWPDEVKDWVKGGVDDSRDSVEYYTGVEVRKTNTEWWVVGEENVMVENLVLLLQRAMRKFKIRGRFGFAWAGDCSRPQTDAYFSGAVCFSQRGVWFDNTFDWLERHRVTVEL